jgi:hypothetical protein
VLKWSAAEYTTETLFDLNTISGEPSASPMISCAASPPESGLIQNSSARVVPTVGSAGRSTRSFAPSNCTAASPSLASAPAVPSAGAFWYVPVRPFPDASAAADPDASPRRQYAAGPSAITSPK